MNAAIYSTLIGVLGGGLFGFLIFQFRTITGSLNRVTDQLKDQGERLARIEVIAVGHGERLARIEAKLDIDPPAEAA